MRICLVSREYPSDDHAGGIGTYTEKTARALARLGHHVIVITEALGKPSIRAEEGVEIHRLPPAGSTTLGKLPYARTLARSGAVAKAVRSLPEAPDIVQACEHAAEAYVYSLRDHRPTRLVTRLATPTSVVAELSPHAGLGQVRVRGLDWLERSQTRRSDAVISVSDALADLVCERWGMPRERVITVRNGVDFVERHGSHPACLPQELANIEYVLYFGRLEERKGVHILAQALPEVLDAHPSVHFVFVGQPFLTYRGEQMQALIERTNERHRDRLHFYPRLPQRDLYPILSGALFVVLPSLWEALANATLESLDAGKPVIATSGSGFAEVIEDGVCGRLVRPGDVADLRAALAEVLADRATLSAMGRAALKRAEQFRQDRVVEDLVNVYEDILDPARELA